MRLLGQSIDARSNLRFSLRRYRLWWALLVITACFDGFTTVLFASSFGLQAEGNALARWLFTELGLLPGVVLGKALQVGAVLVMVSLNRRAGNFFLLFVIVLNCWAIAMNVAP